MSWRPSVAGEAGIRSLVGLVGAQSIVNRRPIALPLAVGLLLLVAVSHLRWLSHRAREAAAAPHLPLLSPDAPEAQVGGGQAAAAPGPRADELGDRPFVDLSEWEPEEWRSPRPVPGSVPGARPPAAAHTGDAADAATDEPDDEAWEAAVLVSDTPPPERK